MTEHLTFTSDGRIYEWGGGFGAVIISRERGVKVGDVRMIEGEIFHVYMVSNYSWPFNNRVCWTQHKLTVEHMRELRARIFGCN